MDKVRDKEEWLSSYGYIPGTPAHAAREKHMATLWSSYVSISAGKGWRGREGGGKRIVSVS